MSTPPSEVINLGTAIISQFPSSINEQSIGSSSSSPSLVQDTVREIVVTDISEVDTDPFSKKSRRKTSSVWSEFTLIKNNEGVEKVQCIHCKIKFAKSKGGATTQYKRHLDHCPRRKVVAEGQQNISVDPSLPSTSTSTTVIAKSTISNWKYDQSKMRELISHMLLVHELPFRFVEYELFNIVMKAASPHYEKISRTTARNDCLASYEIAKKRLRSLLDSVSRVGVTTDLWKSVQDIHYMVITCHFVDSEFNLQKRVINFVDVPPPHRATNIHDLLIKCFKEWGIENKVATITVDNASYNNLAVTMLKESLRFHKSLPLGGELFHVRCCAHILNLLVQEGVSEIKHIIENIRESVKYVTASQHRLVMFSEIATQLNLPSKKLFLDCATRWNATYAMLVRAIEFKRVFPRFRDRDISYTLCPEVDDWVKLEEVCTFLEVFNQATQLISGSEYPTSNLFLGELWGIKEILDVKSVSGPSFIRAMALRMKEKFDKYWGSSNKLIAIGAFFDPRNKLNMVKYVFDDLYSPEESARYYEEVQSSLFTLYSEYVEEYQARNPQNESSTAGVGSQLSDQANPSRPLYGKRKYDSYIRNDYAIQTVKSELEMYLSEGVLHPTDHPTNFTCLEWWKANSLKYRILSRMACDILSIPITTVSSESTFSASGRVIDIYRSSLGTDTVQMLLCGSDWYRNYYCISNKSKVHQDIKEIDLV